eukprot:jgi/Hompol1/1616/HPOL_002728-RA
MADGFDDNKDDKDEGNKDEESESEPEPEPSTQTLSWVRSRYYVAGNESTAQLCRFCRREGHMFRDCREKDTACHLCRADHDPLRCPLGDVCFICFNRGHQKTECSKIWRKYKLIKHGKNTLSRDCVLYRPIGNA